MFLYYFSLQALVVFTAGKYPQQLRQQIRDATRNLRDRGVEIYVVVIGSDVDPRNYYPDPAQRPEYVYNPRDYDRINNFRPQLVDDIRRGEFSFKYKRRKIVLDFQYFDTV